MKIAVVGSGLAGLHAAWLLSCPEHYDADAPLPEVHIIERAAALGMDAASVNVLGGKARVDVPMRGFFARYYPKLVRLYRLVNIATERRNHSLGFFTLRGSIEPTDAQQSFRYSKMPLGAIELALPYPRLGALLHDLATTYSWVRLFYHCHWAANNRKESLPRLAQLTIEEYLIGAGFSREFLDDGFYPVISGICTCPLDDVKSYPAFVIMELFGLGVFWEGVSVVSAGVQEVCKTLSERIHKIYLSAPVEWTETVTTPSGATKVLLKMEGHPVQEYDHVIFASQANQALRMLKDPSPEEAGALAAFKYVRSKVVVHSDVSLMPAVRQDWRSINFFTYHDERGQAVQVMTNQWMNISTPAINDDVPIISTWNPFREPADGTLISESSFERPVVTTQTAGNLKRLWQVQGQRNRWFIGAYAFEGIPLLEGCVESGLRVAKHFGVREERVYYNAQLQPVAGALLSSASPPRAGLHPLFDWLVSLLRQLLPL